MFIPLQNILSKSIKQYHLKDKIDAISICELSNKIIFNIIKSRVDVLQYKNKIILLKVKNSATAAEIKLKEQIIKKELQKNNIEVRMIKCFI